MEEENKFMAEDAMVDSENRQNPSFVVGQHDDTLDITSQSRYFNKNTSR